MQLERRKEFEQHDRRPALEFVTRKKAVKTYRVRAYHDGCGGELVGTERGAGCHPDTPWEHRCKKCDAVGLVRGVNYPAVETS